MHGCIHTLHQFPFYHVSCNIGSYEASFSKTPLLPHSETLFQERVAMMLQQVGVAIIKNCYTLFGLCCLCYPAGFQFQAPCLLAIHWGSDEAIHYLKSLEATGTTTPTQIGLTFSSFDE